MSNGEGDRSAIPLPAPRFHRFCRAAAMLGGWMLLAAAVGVSVEVVLRKLFAVSVGHFTEISSYAFAIGAAWAAAYALLERAHVRIDAVYRYLPLRVRCGLDLIALAGALAYVAVLAYWGLQVLIETIGLGARSNTPLATPLWVPQMLWLLGMVLFLIAGAFMMVLAVRAYRRADLVRVGRLVGTTGLEEEVRASSPGAASPLPNEEGRL